MNWLPHQAESHSTCQTHQTYGQEIGVEGGVVQHQDLEQAIGTQEGQIQVVVQGDKGLLYQEGDNDKLMVGGQTKVGSVARKDKYT